MHLRTIDFQQEFQNNSVEKEVFCFSTNGAGAAGCSHTEV